MIFWWQNFTNFLPQKIQGTLCCKLPIFLKNKFANFLKNKWKTFPHILIVFGLGAVILLVFYNLGFFLQACHS
jgi:hypothetical protein